MSAQQQGGQVDIFGYKHTEQTGGVMSFQDVAVSIGSEKMYLVQQASLQYRRTITPIMAAGTATVYLAPQPGTGEFTMTRAIGGASGPASAKLKLQSACDPVEIKIAKSDAGTGCAEVPGADITMSGLMSGYQFQINVGSGVSVTDGATYTITTVTTADDISQQQQQ